MQLFKGCSPHPHWPLVWLTSNEPGEIYGLPRPRVVALVNYAKKATLGSCFGFVLICVSLVFGSAKRERAREEESQREREGRGTINESHLNNYHFPRQNARQKLIWSVSSHLISSHLVWAWSV